MNELQLFEEKNISLFDGLNTISKGIETLKAKEDEIKAKIKDAMDQYNIKSFENDLVKITRVKHSESTSLDVKKLKDEDEELYQDLMNSYKKVTKRKGYIRITPKKN